MDCCSVAQWCLTLRPHGLQHARLSCPSPSPRVCSNSSPLSQWCYPTISSSVGPAPSPPAFSLSQHQGLFQWVHSLHQVAKVLELQHQSFQWIFRVDFLWDWLVWSPCCPGNSQESSPAPQFKSTNSSRLSLLYGPALTSIHDSWKNHSFGYKDLSRQIKTVNKCRIKKSAMQETRVWSLSWKDLLEKGMATHSSILAWRIPWTEEPGGLQSMASQTVRH